jgi:hypothetical protein
MEKEHKILLAIIANEVIEMAEVHTKISNIDLINAMTIFNYMLLNKIRTKHKNNKAKELQCIQKTGMHLRDLIFESTNLDINKLDELI